MAIAILDTSFYIDHWERGLYLTYYCSTKRVQQIPLFPPLPKGDERGISFADSVTHKAMQISNMFG